MLIWNSQCLFGCNESDCCESGYDESDFHKQNAAKVQTRMLLEKLGNKPIDKE